MLSRLAPNMQTRSMTRHARGPHVPESGSARRSEWDDQPGGFCSKAADDKGEKVVPASISADEFHEAMAWEVYLEMMAEQRKRSAKARSRMSS